MRRSFFRKLILSCLVACFFSLTAFAQDYKSMLGKWNMTSDTDDESVKWILTVKDDNGKIAVFLTGESGNDQPIKDATYKDGVLKFEAPYEGDFYDIELKEKEGKLDGTWSGSGTTGHTGGVKADS